MAGRLSSGITGLDAILQGGFFEAGITIVQGQPGTGKTILGNQLCFNHVKRGGRALYVTLLAETHERMLMHLGSLDFFDESAIPDHLFYISAFPALERDGLPGLLALLRREVQARNATVLVLDGLVAAEQRAGSAMEFKKFIHGLQAQAALASCTMFLLTSAGVDPHLATAAHTMVDCLVDMRSRLFGWRGDRSIEIVKRRGDGFMRGPHAMRISQQGISAYPRFETLLERPSGPHRSSGPPISSGLAALDAMFGGGLPCRSTTMAVGPAGAGKTTLGLHFLGACSAECRGVLFTTFETPDAILEKARALNLPVAQAIEAGHVSVIWHPVSNGLLDDAVMSMYRTVQTTASSRLFIDGWTGLAKLSPVEDRLVHVFSALMHELRSLDVTTLFTFEHEEAGPTSTAGIAGMSDLSGITENIVVLRLLEQDDTLMRRISVLKSRDSRIDPRIHPFDIDLGGIDIGTLPPRRVSAAPSQDG